ncbi:MAG TPA: hypothetical protein VFR90_10730 [Methylibium sp.]|uniref:hypothetical protein n=1 Tax=Methylibium sp. TaxID=2067992 RepID=UPI002DB86B5C|nr:hypothetical protein [Methylibium sp.]HEU4459588.1 hypothetical protein [Methylibium sp.]
MDGIGRYAGFAAEEAARAYGNLNDEIPDAEGQGHILNSLRKQTLSNSEDGLSTLSSLTKQGLGNQALIGKYGETASEVGQQQIADNMNRSMFQQANFSILKRIATDSASAMAVLTKGGDAIKDIVSR